MLARLKQITQSKTDTSLSSALGISPQTLSSWKLRDSIPYAICVNVADQHDISLDWLLIGAGPQLRKHQNTHLLDSREQSPWEIEILAQLRALHEADRHWIASAVQEKMRIHELEQRLDTLIASLPPPTTSP